MVYLPTFGCFQWQNLVNVAKYTIHGSYGFGLFHATSGHILATFLPGGAMEIPLLENSEAEVSLVP